MIALPFLFNILIIQPVEILVLAKHMDQRDYLDKAVKIPLPDKFPQLYIVLGIAHAAHLDLRLTGVSAHGVVIDGHALMDRMDDKILDLFHMLPDDMDVVKLGSQIEDHIVHAAYIDQLAHEGVRQDVKVEHSGHKEDH